MRLKHLVVLAVLLGGSIAAATAMASWDVFARYKTSLFIKGVAVGPDIGVNKVTGEVQNVITDSRGKYFAYQFGAIQAANSPPQYGGTIDGPTIAVTGTRMGDTCEVASDRSIWDGGRPAFVRFDCQVPAEGYVLLRATADNNDAGVALTILDAGYYIRTTSFLAR